MTRRQKLKVYRTPIGFHDAYVAAASQKAALDAWGSNVNLFARGAAEVVTDPMLTADPLAKPGTVIKRLRESPAGDDELPQRSPARSETAKRKSKERPRPDRSRLDATEQAIHDIEERHRKQLDDLAAREAELRRERETLEARQDAEMKRLASARDRARTAYRRAIEKWRAA